MNQDDFIRAFQEALAGKVSEHIIRENTEYYRNYISTQVAQGMREADVLASLGDPRLLAKTVVESQKFSNEGQSSYRDAYSDSKEQKGFYTDEEPKTELRKAPAWVMTVLWILVIVAVLGFVFSVISFFAPVIITGLVIFFAIKVLKNIFSS